ncbi:MAG: DUF2514 family protein, partial [Rubrivivax sp.]|nr:DUF2514 family protein [Rubrivivax sp.]
MIAILGRIPMVWWIVIALAGWGGFSRVQVAHGKAALVAYKAEVQAAFDKQKAADAAESERRNKQVQEAADAAFKQAEKDRADAAGARAALDQLRQRLAARSNSGAVRPPASPGSAPTEGAANVPADLFLRCAGRIVELAEYAD